MIAWLQDQMSERLVGTRSAKSVVKRRQLVNEGCSPEEVRPWKVIRRMLRGAGEGFLLKAPLAIALVVPDANNLD